MHGSDLPAAGGLQSVADPYTGEEVYVVPSLRPDWAVLHVHEADALGNARIYGSVFWDRIMSRAARGVILSAERIVSTDELIRQPELTVVPSMLVGAVVEAPAGSRPCSCSPEYDVDWTGVEAYLTAARDRASLDEYLARSDEALYPRRSTVLDRQRERPAPVPAQPVSAGRPPY